MHKLQSQVLDFMRKFNQPIPPAFQLLRPTVKDLRMRLHAEEGRELQEALDSNDLEKVLDGLVDNLYVLYGTFAAMGVDAEKLCDVVHENNMKKAWQREELRYMPDGSWACPLTDGTFAVLLNGKVIKPPSWKPVALVPLLTVV